MARRIRPELSENNPYHISKHRYYELKHYCLQYPEWKQELLKINYLPIDIFDPTGEIAVKEANLISKISRVENLVQECSGVLSPWLLAAVTQDFSYTYLRVSLDIPCGKDMYYACYRKFFWMLSQEKHTV